MNVPGLSILGALLALALAAPANAHVTLAPETLAPGAVAELTFRCPNERPAGAMTQLAVELPQNDPLRIVKIRPVAGWHATVTMRNRTVDTIVWSGGSIKPGAYQNFSILAGPMPRGVRELAFKAVQTYADGDAVRWIELRGPGEPEPAHPAPIVRLRYYGR